jgi:tRNA 2-thiouridine synthesizing protein A
MRELDVGGLLTVRATDPAAEQDFPAYCRQTGHELVSATREGDVLVFVIRKKA